MFTKFGEVVLKKGSRWQAVNALQWKLGITADGVFGSKTESALKAYQERKQLKVTGITSRNVWRALTGMTYIKSGLKTSTTASKTPGTIRAR